MEQPLDIRTVREAFPFFSANPNLAYLDNSATSQIPIRVIDRLDRYYLHEKASPFRGLYDLSVKATDDYEQAREEVRAFIDAESAQEIIFTRNASESLNLCAYSLGELVVREGDDLVVSIAEHHSNMLPWQQLALRKKAQIHYLPCSREGAFDLDTLAALLTPRTRILAITQMSNVFGRINDLKAICALAHEKGVLVVADGCQSVPHIPVSVRDLGVDFLAFSGHKMLAPMGIGVLYGKRELLQDMPPFLTGGEMIDSVTTEGAVWAPLPQKFEAGTVNTGGAIALGEAIRYYRRIGFSRMLAREEVLTCRLMKGMADLPHVHIVGSGQKKDHHGIVTFILDGVHPHDISDIMSMNGVAIRAGHHCAQPLHQFLGLNATSRASLMFYNTEEEIDRFLDVLSGIRGAMGYAD